LYQSDEDFAEYLEAEKVVGLVIIHDGDPMFMQYCMQYIERYGYSQKIEDVNGDLYILNG
jgi:hypothetical protein